MGGKHPPSWSTPRFVVEGGGGAVTMRRRATWRDAATIILFVSYATAIASGALAFVGPDVAVVGIVLATMGMVVAGLMRAERLGSAPFVRVPRSALEAASTEGDDTYRDDRSHARTLRVDGEALDASTVRRVVLAHRALPQRYGPTRQGHAVCIVLDRCVVRAEEFRDDEPSARRLARQLAKALRCEDAIDIVDETWVGGGGAMALLLLLVVVEIFFAVGAPAVVLTDLGKNATLARSLLTGIAVSIAIVACNVVVGLVAPRLMGAMSRRHVARVFGLEL